MGFYHINEGRFEVPNEWSDQTVNIFSSAQTVPGEFSFVITREAVEEGEDLRSFAERQLKQLSEGLPQFQLRNRSKTTVDSAPALEAVFTWRSENGIMYQRQVYLFYNKKALILTATTLEEFARKYESVLDQILSTFKFGRRLSESN